MVFSCKAVDRSEVFQFKVLEADHFDRTIGEIIVVLDSNEPDGLSDRKVSHVDWRGACLECAEIVTHDNELSLRAVCDSGREHSSRRADSFS